MLTQALESARETAPDAEADIYTFEKKAFSGCIHCYGCRREGHEGQCVIDDDFKDLASLWWKADAVIYSVPVYHMSIPGQLKCFIDRLGQSGITKLVPSGPGSGFVKPLKAMGIITQGMHIFSGQEHAITELVNHALITGCLPIAPDLWEGYIGACGWTELSRDKRAIETLHQEGTISARAAVASARSLGRNVAHLTLVLQAGKRTLNDQ
jgi:multimeric flavodoxin WrbA